SRANHRTAQRRQASRSYRTRVWRRRTRHLSFHSAPGIRRSRAIAAQWAHERRGSHRGRRAIPRGPQSGGRQIRTGTLRLDAAHVTKTPTLKMPVPVRPEASRAEEWQEFRSVFPIYLALAKQLEIAVPFPPDKRNLPEKPSPELFKQVQTLLDSLDQRVLVHQLRHLLQMTTLNASEASLRSLIQRHLRKPSKTNIDRDKIDFLLVHYFALCAPAKIYHKQIELDDVAVVMEPVLGEVDSAPLDWCQPLEKVIITLRTFRSVRDMLKTNFIAEGRKVKEAAGEMFYDPCAMLAFIRFNFLLRRTLIELMHADLINIRNGLEQLDTSGVSVLDCKRFGLSASEPVSKIRALTDEWKQPFQKDYTERTVSEAFEKLLNLRADVGQALEHPPAKQQHAQ